MKLTETMVDELTNALKVDKNEIIKITQSNKEVTNYLDSTDNFSNNEKILYDRLLLEKVLKIEFLIWEVSPLNKDNPYLLPSYSRLRIQALFLCNNSGKGMINTGKLIRETHWMWKMFQS